MEKKSKGSGVRIERRDILKMMSVIPAALVPVTPFAAASRVTSPKCSTRTSGERWGYFLT